MPPGLLVALGVLLVAGGSFFALQGAGVIAWPAESFMVRNESWILNGPIVAFVGVLILLWGLRKRPR